MAVLYNIAARLLTNRTLRGGERWLASLGRRAFARPAQVHYFHQADDPYSHLIAQVLPEFLRRYSVVLRPHLVPDPPANAAPERQRLQGWSRRDAEALAKRLRLHFVDKGQQPTAESIALANRALTASIARKDFTSAASIVGAALWNDDHAGLLQLAAAPQERATDALRVAAALRRRRGHYLGATLFFEGEWYWGVDRLHYLEERLRAAGLGRCDSEPHLSPIAKVQCHARPSNGHRPELHFYCSLRSPYTYVSLPRVVRIAEHYGARLHLRFVLPMVMRGLPVPLQKRVYILKDANREAESHGMPFGRIADPVGAPTERGLAVLHKAIAVGAAVAFAESFLRGVWSEGIDAGTDRGLHRIAARVGLDAAFVGSALADPSWRVVAEANRAELFRLGLWGVPSFRVDDRPAVWGQDRLWWVEGDLISATSA